MTATVDEYTAKLEKLKASWKAVIEKGVDSYGNPVFLVPKARAERRFYPDPQELLEMIHALSEGTPVGGFTFTASSSIAAHAALAHNLQLVVDAYRCSIDVATP